MAARRRGSRNIDNAEMDDLVSNYVDNIASQHRPLFDRLHRLILEAHPDAEVGLAYHMPCYRVGGRRLFVGAWRRWVSIYGWDEGRDGGFCARHPDLKTGRGTIQLRPGRADTISDAEFGDLIHAALDG